MSNSSPSSGQGHGLLKAGWGQGLTPGSEEMIESWGGSPLTQDPDGGSACLWETPRSPLPLSWGVASIGSGGTWFLVDWREGKQNMLLFLVVMSLGGTGTVCPWHPGGICGVVQAVLCGQRDSAQWDLYLPKLLRVFSSIYFSDEVLGNSWLGYTEILYSVWFLINTLVKGGCG